MSAFLLRITSFFIVLSFFFVGCQPTPKWKHYEGGIHLVLQVESKGNSTVDSENTARIAENIEKRVKQFGIKNIIIKVQGERQIVIQLPPCKNPDRVADLIGKSCFLEFKLVDEEHSVEEALKGNIPSGTEILYQKTLHPKTDQQIKIPYLIVDKTLMTGDALKDARVSFNQHNMPYIAISMNPAGARDFDQITAENVGRRLAIILDDNVYSAPVIRERISGGEAIIEGHFTLEEANDLAIILRTGSFPVQTEVIENRPLSRELWLGDN